LKPRVPRKFNPEICRWVKRTALVGNPDLATINTSRAERLNLSVRLFNRRFTRLTLGYSKTLEHHKAAAALFTAFYNYCRPHSSIKQTPAQAAGLTDHVWTAKELISDTI
jgi:transposase InsO family protein